MNVGKSELRPNGLYKNFVSLFYIKRYVVCTKIPKLHAGNFLFWTFLKLTLYDKSRGSVMIRVSEKLARPIGSFP